MATLQTLLPIPTPRDTIAQRFFRRAFGIFLAFAVFLTMILIGETLWLGQKNLQNELAIYERTFGKSLASALWAMDREKLESIVNGITEIPDIKGIRIYDPVTGNTLIQSGTVADEDRTLANLRLVHHFDIIHDEGFGRELVAKAEFLSTIGQLLQRTQGQILLIILIAILKTLVFWWIFFVVGRRLLSRPLNEITQSIAAAGSIQRLHLSKASEAAIADTELAQLRDAYDSLADRDRASQSALETANTALETRIQERTRQLHEINQLLEQSMSTLKEKDRAKSTFFAAANHDLRQPIQAMGLFLDALKNTERKEDQARIIRALEIASNTLGEQLESLLDLSKLDAGAVTPCYAPENALDIFSALEITGAPLALEHKLRFKLWFPQRPVTLMVDKHLLLRVLNNLVGNAFKYTVTGGVLVALRQRHDAWTFQIWDTGAGIGAEHQDRIYDEYFQIDNPHRDRAKGMGLGLSIVKRLCDLLGYGLNCRSRVGRGTLFEVRIPLEDACNPRAAAVAAQQVDHVDHVDHGDPAKFSGTLFTVVEDDALAAGALKEWLTLHGIDVQLYENAELALADPRVHASDYFIADHQLSGQMTGLDFLEGIQRSHTEPIKALIMTGNTSAGFVGLAQKSRWPVLFKPVKPVKLLSTLASLDSAAEHDTPIL